MSDGSFNVSTYGNNATVRNSCINLIISAGVFHRLDPQGDGFSQTAAGIPDHDRGEKKARNSRVPLKSRSLADHCKRARFDAIFPNPAIPTKSMERVGWICASDGARDGAESRRKSYHGTLPL